MVLTARDEECTPDVLRIAPVWPVAGSSGVAITDAGVTVGWIPGYQVSL